MQVFLQLLLPMLKAATHPAVTTSLHTGHTNAFLSWLYAALGTKGISAMGSLIQCLLSSGWQVRPSDLYFSVCTVVVYIVCTR